MSLVKGSYAHFSLYAWVLMARIEPLLSIAATTTDPISLELAALTQVVEMY